MPVVLPPNFPAHDTSLSIFQKKKIWDSFSDLQPYIEDYFVVYTQCSKDNLADVSAYIFLKDKTDLSNISECRSVWNLPTLKINGPSQFIICPFPEKLIKSVYSDNKNFHLGGSIRCFHYSY